MLLHIRNKMVTNRDCLLDSLRIVGIKALHHGVIEHNAFRAQLVAVDSEDIRSQHIRKHLTPKCALGTATCLLKIARIS